MDLVINVMYIRVRYTKQYTEETRQQDLFILKPRIISSKIFDEKVIKKFEATRVRSFELIISKVNIT